MENTKRLKDTIVAVGDVVNYSTYPSNTCFPAKLHLQEDEKCKTKQSNARQGSQCPRNNNEITTRK